jgi:hypothetical protein
MATQTASLPAGQTLNVTTFIQQDASGNPLATPNPNYAEPVVETIDSTFFNAVQVTPGNWDLISTGKVGSTTVVFSETSSVSTDPVITDTYDITVTGPVAAGLSSTATVS